jgi:hypothetical protein
VRFLVFKGDFFRIFLVTRYGRVSTNTKRTHASAEKIRKKYFEKSDAQRSRSPPLGLRSKQHSVQGELTLARVRVKGAQKTVPRAVAKAQGAMRYAAMWYRGHLANPRI